MKIAITGHRPNKLGNDYNLTSPLLLKIKIEIVSRIAIIGLTKPITLITGCALGIDTLFARIAMEHHIPYIAAVPCQDQDKMWTIESKREYALILKHAKEVVFVTNQPYNNTCMQLRNQWMVDNCNLLLAVWNGMPGGTANCVKYAQFSKKPIIYINPDQL